MPEFHRTNPLVTGIDPAVLEAQRQANAAMAGSRTRTRTLPRACRCCGP